MRTDLFDFELPPERIALRPASPRDAARLLVLRPGAVPEFDDRGVRDQAGEERRAKPLPPYIAARGAPDERDRTDYQTMFARAEGPVTAPTAGLHFAPAVVERLKARGIAMHQVTLHVGAGTFLPVKNADTSGHRMHAETGSVSAQAAAALNEVRRAGGRIVAVGSTSLRLLETA